MAEIDVSGDDERPTAAPPGRAGAPRGTGRARGGGGVG